jgi:hypothetical protein
MVRLTSSAKPCWLKRRVGGFCSIYLSPSFSQSMSSFLRCTVCHDATAAQLLVCPRCYKVACRNCAAVENKQGSIRARKQQHLACTACKVQRISLREASPVVHRLCSNASDDAAIDDGLCCAVCSQLAFNNRVCPICFGLFCNLCLHQWCQKESKDGGDVVSCGLCRSTRSLAGFSHDLLVGRLARHQLDLMLGQRL